MVIRCFHFYRWLYTPGRTYRQDAIMTVLTPFPQSCSPTLLSLETCHFHYTRHLSVRPTLTRRLLLASGSLLSKQSGQSEQSSPPSDLLPSHHHHFGLLLDPLFSAIRLKSQAKSTATLSDATSRSRHPFSVLLSQPFFEIFNLTSGDWACAAINSRLSVKHFDC